MSFCCCSNLHGVFRIKQRMFRYYTYLQAHLRAPDSARRYSENIIDMERIGDWVGSDIVIHKTKKVPHHVTDITLFCMSVDILNSVVLSVS